MTLDMLYKMGVREIKIHGFYVNISKRIKTYLITEDYLIELFGELERSIIRYICETEIFYTAMLQGNLTASITEVDKYENGEIILNEQGKDTFVRVLDTHVIEKFIPEEHEDTPYGQFGCPFLEYTEENLCI